MWKFVDDMTISKISLSYEGIEAIYKVLFQQQQLVKRTLCLQLSPTKCSKELVESL